VEKEMRRTALHFAGLGAVSTLLLAMLGSCGGQPDSGSRTVIDETVTIAEGESVVYALGPAWYSISVTSRPNGVTVIAPAGGCYMSVATQNFGGTCTLTEQVNLLAISNPADADRGAPETVSIRVYTYR
jgi:hypothetical protein